MADKPERFSGARIRPVGGPGRMVAQQPVSSGNVKREGGLLFELERDKAEKIVRVVYLEPSASPYQVTSDDEMIICNTNAGIIEVQLPRLNGQTGRLLTIKKFTASANSVDLRAGDNQTIDGASLRQMNGANRACVQLRAYETGLNWLIVASFGTVV